MRSHFYFIILTISCLLASLNLPAQNEPGGLYVSGRITTEQGNVGGTVIKMFRNGQPMIDYQVDNTGRFNLRFEFNNEYILIFQRPENFPQKYVISTIVPNAVLQRDRIFPPYPLDVNLFTEIAGINRGFADNTVLRIYYSPEVDNFIPEVYYNNAQIKRLIEVAIMQSQSVNREAELLKRLSNAELAALRREYDEILRQAGADFDKGEYLEALDEYKAASRIFPSEKFPRDRIAEINDLIAVLGLQDELNRQQAEKYNQFIQTADQQFTARQYPQSKENYQQALIIRPADDYATRRIAEIDAIEAQMQAQNRYNDVIALADKAFDEKLWDESKKRYQEALQIRPGESYPTAQIALIDQELQQLNQLAERQSTFESAVLNGDASYARQFYPKALEYYRTALSIKPDDAAVIAKIAKVEKEQKEINDRLFYDETIKTADKAYKDQDYDNARTLYASALTARPDQTYPQNQINAIDKIVGDNQRYADLIARADASLAAQNYTSARENFKAALEMKPREKYPADKIREIDGVLAGLAREDQQYRQLLAGADRFYNARQYPQAKGEYQKATGIRPDDPYPTEMLQKITDWETEQVRLAEAQRQEEENRLISEQQLKDRQYQALIDEADQLAAADELVTAVSKFRDALQVKPQEQYPIRRIEEIRGMIARQTEAQKSYDTAIAAADEAFQQERYPEARTGYQQALEAKPSESYPTDQIARIDSIEAEQARLLAEKQAAEEAARLAALEEQARLQAERQAAEEAARAEQARILAEKQAAEEAARLAALAEKDRLYNEAISAGDALYNQQDFTKAIVEYRKASQVKPEETYPKERMTQCEQSLAQLAEQEGRNRDYMRYIGIADRAFSDQNYSSATSNYQQAQTLKPEEAYPQQRLAEITRILAQKEIDDKYRQLLAAADGFFRTSTWEQARSGYHQALEVKPDEAYPKSQIAKIDENLQRLAQLAQQQAAQQAAPPVPVAATPSSATTSADPNRGVTDELEALYQSYIAVADETFTGQQYNVSRAWYYKALDVKPAETYPVGRIAEINRLLSQMIMSERDREFQQYINQGDDAFNNDQLAVARGWYNRALTVRANDAHALSQIREIQQSIDSRLQGGADKVYKDYMAEGDKAFEQKNYSVARVWYRRAHQLKPAETLPGEKLEEIRKLLN